MTRIQEFLNHAPQSEPQGRAAMGAKGARHFTAPGDQSLDHWADHDPNSSPKKPVRLVALNEGLARAGVTRAQYYSMRKRGLAPEPVKLSPGRRGAIRLVDSEIDDWIASLMATRSNKPAL